MDKADIPIAMTQNDVYRCPICHRFGYASVCQTLTWFDGPKFNHNHVYEAEKYENMWSLAMTCLVWSLVPVIQHQRIGILRNLDDMKS